MRMPGTARCVAHEKPCAYFREGESCAVRLFALEDLLFHGIVVNSSNVPTVFPKASETRDSCFDPLFLRSGPLLS